LLTKDKLSFSEKLCTANPILSTLGSLCDYDFGAVAVFTE